MMIVDHVKKILPAVVLIAFVICLGSCRKSHLAAQSEIYNTKDEKIGSAVLEETRDGVKIKVSVKNLQPGLHAIHIHEKGKFVPPDFKAAGAHFNPFGKEHGVNNPKGHHVGDLPNLEVKNDGSAQLEFIIHTVTLIKGEKNSLLREEGTSIIIHEKADDNVTNPAGNSGDRIAGGSIVETK